MRKCFFFHFSLNLFPFISMYLYPMYPSMFFCQFLRFLLVVVVVYPATNLPDLSLGWTRLDPEEVFGAGLSGLFLLGMEAASMHRVSISVKSLFRFSFSLIRSSFSSLSASPLHHKLSTARFCCCRYCCFCCRCCCFCLLF